MKVTSNVAALDSGPSASKTAILVDADPQVEAVVRSVLTQNNWIIQHAPDNVTALAIAQSKTCDLILTGAKTSGKEDVELLRKIRCIHSHTRLIILTDETTPTDVIASMRQRAFSYFSTPFSYESLTEIIRLAVEDPCWDDGIEVLSATPAWIQLAARCDLGTAERLVQFINEITEDPEKNDIAMAFREMLLNAIEHGGQFNPNEYVEISYLRARHIVVCRIKDPGKGFALDEVRHAAMSNPADQPFRHVLFREAQGLRPGGYGVLLAQHYVDELIYGEKGNDVLLVKYLGTIPVDR